MNRDFSGLADKHFDLLVVGGGIYGAWTALDAAGRGLSVALVERGDWAAGTSSASSKLIHGGLRYLQQFKFGLVKISLRERRALMAIAPHLVRPLRFHIPIYKGGVFNRITMKAGLTIYDLLAGSVGRIHGHDYLNAVAAIGQYPFVTDTGLLGDFTYWDAQTDDCRFTLAVVGAAMAAGVCVSSYTEAVELIEADGRMRGARVKDVLSVRQVDIRAKVVVNAAGPWGPRLPGCDKLAGSIRLTKGVHLVMPDLDCHDAMLITAASDGRVFFMIPWYGRTLLGTTDTDFCGDPDEAGVRDGDIDYLLSEANLVIKGPGWQRTDIISTFAGLRALINEPGLHPSQITREWQLNEPCPGLLASIGGKFTSARVDAAKIVDRAAHVLGRDDLAASSTTDLRLAPVPGGDYNDWHDQNMQRGHELGLDEPTIEQLIFRYGGQVVEIFALIETRPELARPLVADLHFCAAEVVYAARQEMVVTLNDILRRRLPLLILAAPDINLCREVAALAAPSLNWSVARQATEVVGVMAEWQEKIP